MNLDPAKEIYSFLEHHVDLYNCGQHDYDNSFLAAEEPGLIGEFAEWQALHPFADPIGICEENKHRCGNAMFVAMVYEEEGNRYFVHVPPWWVEEYKVFEKGPRARRLARSMANKGLVDADLAKPEDDFNSLTKKVDTAISETKEIILEKTDPAYVEVTKVASGKAPKPDPNNKNAERAYFTCDVPHSLGLMYDVFREDGNAGLMVCVKYISDIFFQIAARASELNDPKLNEYMLKCHLYDVEDVNKALKDLKKEQEESCQT